MSRHHTDQHDRSPKKPTTHNERGQAQSQRQPLPRFNVILHFDPGYALMHVVRAVMELTRFCRAEATHRMWEAHHRGQSIILTTWLERAELYVEQFADKQINVSVAPVS